MAQVPDRILSWLWSVLQQYTHSRLAYSDSVSALSAFPSLQPRTSVYTYESGHTALLLCLAGTLPVDFRGTIYRYPVEIWLPQEYGEIGVGIICYVKPGDGGKGGNAGDIVIRPGQHVSVDGRIYHPYLRDWGLRERSNIVDFLRIAQDIFAREPPVIAKQHQRQSQTRQIPVPPPKDRPGSIQPVGMPTSSIPPPLPAKPVGQPQPSSSSQYDRTYQDQGPPLPPLPYIQAKEQASSSGNPSRNGMDTPPQQSSQRYSSTHAVPPPPPPLPAYAVQQSHRSNGERSPVSPLSPENGRGDVSSTRYTQPQSPLHHRQMQHPVPRDTQHTLGQPALQQLQQYSQQQQHQQQQYASPHNQHEHHNHPQAHGRQAQYQTGPMPQYQQNVPIQRQAPQPMPDLLTDPFDISLPASIAATGPAPPIPPNPEKEHLLSMLSHTLVSQIDGQLQQNAAAIAPLRAQNAALHDAHARLNAELAQLQALDSALGTNEAILRQALRDCDKVIETSKSTPAPNIDDVLVAPTIAAQQLWYLCADEAAIKEALWCLQRAVGAGRVSGPDFVRLTRGLAREAFLKMALSRKIAKGLGLDVAG